MVWRIELATMVPGTPAELVVVGHVWGNFTLTDDLAGSGSARVGLRPAAQTPAVRECILGIATGEAMCELWAWQDDTLTWAGPVIGFSQQPDGLLELNCLGLLGWMAYARVETTLTFDADDKFSIGQALIDHAQSQVLGDRGLDTTGIGLLGDTDDRHYDRNEEHVILQRLTELADEGDGFDAWVIPSSRTVTFAAARGVDKTASVLIDGSRTRRVSLLVSVAPGDIATDVVAVSVGEVTRRATAGNTTLRTALGRMMRWEPRFDVRRQTRIQAIANRVLAQTDQPLIVPSWSMVARTGADWGDLDPGDTLRFQADIEVGTLAVTTRLSSKTIEVTDDGTETLTFAGGAP